MKRFSLMAAAGLSLAAGTILTACDDDVLNTILGIVDDTDDGTRVVIDDKGLGWLERDEDTSEVEDDIQINTGGGSIVGGKVAGVVDLSPWLPPIGNQGSYGSCTAWATAYYARTWLYAHAHDLKTNDLTKEDIFSPAYIFKALDYKYKNEKCKGSCIFGALRHMQYSGVASWSGMGRLQFESKEDCDCDNTAAADKNAAKYKIGSYREVEIGDPAKLKRYLYEGHPIVFGARLGDNFMNARGSDVLYSHGTFNRTGMHSYHAITLVGYDDNMGKNGAFKVVNSWGESWGDDGFIWIDYDFFCNGDASGEFAQYGFALYESDENDKGYGDPSSNVDLQPYKVTDVDYEDDSDPDAADPTWRTLTYDVCNAGSGNVPASASWGNCYLLYNAYNANQYTIVLIDLYSDQLGLEKGEMNGQWDPEEASETLGGVEAQGYSLTNIDIPGGASVASTVNGEESYFSWTYKMPDVTGKYYMVLMADAFCSVTESDESNNYYFLTNSEGGPLEFENGVLKTDISNNKSLRLATAKPKQNAHFAEQTAVTPAALNTYTPEEISALINAARKSGDLRNKAMQWARTVGMSPAKPRRVVKMK